MPTTPDFIFAFLIAIAFPIYAPFEYRRFKQEVAAGRADARPRAYLHTMILQWLLAAVAVGVWVWSERSWGELGLVPSLRWRFWVSAAVALALVGFLIWQMRAVTSARGDQRARVVQQLAGQLEPVKDLLPNTAREMRLFAGVSITAGVCEELLYRAYLIWFLAAFFGMWPAAIISTLIFAAAHLYQGPRPAVKIIFVGGTMAALYLFSGCVWLPMLVHATTDVTSGVIGYAYLREPTAEAKPA